MKIAFLMTQSLESPSGLGRHAPIARELARMGHKIEVYALHPNWKRLQQKIYVDNGVHVRYVSQMHVSKIESQKQYFTSNKLIWIAWLATLRLAKALWSSDAEIVHVCKPHPMNSSAARLAARGRPVYFDCDDYEAETNLFSGNWQRSIVRHFEDKIVDHASGITVNTEFNLERYIALAHSDINIIHVPNGVERNRFNLSRPFENIRQHWGIDENAPLIVYIGTLGLLSHPIDLLLEAFQMISPAIPTARLLLVGGGEDYEKLQVQAQKLGIAHKTIFTGRQPPELIPDFLFTATVTVDPVKNDLIAKSRCPLKIIESLAMGIPVITGDIGDRRKLLNNGKYGILVQPGDSHALADALQNILDNSNNRKKCVQAIREQSGRWYWDQLIDDFINIYQRPLCYREQNN